MRGGQAVCAAAGPCRRRAGDAGASGDLCARVRVAGVMGVAHAGPVRLFLRRLPLCVARAAAGAQGHGTRVGAAWLGCSVGDAVCVRTTLCVRVHHGVCACMAGRSGGMMDWSRFAVGCCASSSDAACCGRAGQRACVCCRRCSQVCAALLQILAGLLAPSCRRHWLWTVMLCTAVLCA